MNISLASLKKNTGFVSVNTVTGQDSMTMCYQHSRHEKVTKWHSCRVAGWVELNVYGLHPKVKKKCLCFQIIGGLVEIIGVYYI